MMHSKSRLNQAKDAMNRKKGFTLLEMIVSLAIFAVVAVIAVGALVRITSLNRQAQSLQSAMNNISFALESMSREMRMGTDFNRDEDGNGITITFDSSEIDEDSTEDPPCHLRYGYRITPENLMQKAMQVSSCSEDLSSAYTSILDDVNVKITNYAFTMNKVSGYARVSIVLEGYSGSRPREQNSFSITTVVAQRIGDIIP